MREKIIFFSLRHFICRREKRKLPSVRFSRHVCILVIFVLQKNSHSQKYGLWITSLALSRQDWSRLQRSRAWQNVRSSKVLSAFVGKLFFHFSRARSDNRVRAASDFHQEKHRERERTTNRKSNVCTEGGLIGEQDNTKRESGEKRMVEKSDVPCPIRREGGGGKRERNDQKWRAIWRLLSFSSHCSPLSLLFSLFPVPRSPFSELHAPNPTSDPHKGRRGRDTFGKSASTPL